MRELPILDVTDTRRTDAKPRAWDSTERRPTSGQDRALGRAQQSQAIIEADPYNVLVLNYTMKCPLACDFCCYACHPGRRETMSLATALDVVDQAASLGVFKQIGFTGGEPLLFQDEVLTICSRLQGYQIPFSMISSCHWATSERQTGEVVDALVERGLAVLSISHDPSHGAWVDPANVRRAVAAVTAHGVPAVVCASFYSTREKLEDAFPELVDNPLVELVNRVVLPVGMSKQRKLTPKSYGIEQDSATFACYKRIYHDVTVFWDGECYPCCSVYNRATKGLSLGNIHEKTLAEIWDSVEGSLMYRVMKGQGFSQLYSIIAEIDPELHSRLPDISTSLGPCQLCHRIFSDPALSGGIKTSFDAYERQKIAAILDAVAAVDASSAKEMVTAALDGVR